MCLLQGGNDAVNLKFVHERRKPRARRIHPGFSARRYLSRLTRSFDDTFLEKLTQNGKEPFTETTKDNNV